MHVMPIGPITSSRVSEAIANLEQEVLNSVSL